MVEFIQSLFILTGLTAWLVWGGLILCLFIAELRSVGTVASLAVIAAAAVLYFHGIEIDPVGAITFAAVYILIGVGYAFLRRYLFFKVRAVQLKKLYDDYLLRKPEGTKEDFQKNNHMESVSYNRLRTDTARWVGNWPISALVYILETVFPQFFETIAEIFKGFFRLADKLGKSDLEKS
jgi:hypothetical protein